MAHTERQKKKEMMDNASLCHRHVFQVFFTSIFFFLISLFSLIFLYLNRLKIQKQGDLTFVVEFGFLLLTASHLFLSCNIHISLSDFDWPAPLSCSHRACCDPSPLGVCAPEHLLFLPLFDRCLVPILLLIT